MARLLKWTEDAADDIVSIAEFISRDSEFYAKAVVQKIMEKIAAILLFETYSPSMDIKNQNYRL